MKYFAQCFIDPVKSDQITTLRSNHLEYIEKVSSIISYGGVCGSKEKQYQSICFFLDVSNKNEVSKFVEYDPYSSIYSSVEIKEFDQKIPEL